MAQKKPVLLKDRPLLHQLFKGLGLIAFCSPALVMLGLGVLLEHENLTTAGLIALFFFGFIAIYQITKVPPHG